MKWRLGVNSTTCPVGGHHGLRPSSGPEFRAWFITLEDELSGGPLYRHPVLRFMTASPVRSTCRPAAELPSPLVCIPVEKRHWSMESRTALPYQAAAGRGTGGRSSLSVTITTGIPPMFWLASQQGLQKSRRTYLGLFSRRQHHPAAFWRKYGIFGVETYAGDGSYACVRLLLLIQKKENNNA